MSKALQSQSVPAGLTPAFPPGLPAGQSVIAVTDTGSAVEKAYKTDWANVLAKWQEAERRVLLMSQRLAGVKSRRDDHDALIAASVACNFKIEWARDCMTRYGGAE